MTKDEEQMIANIMHRMHVNEQARIESALASARADAVARAEADRKRIAGLTEELRLEQEEHMETKGALAFCLETLQMGGKDVERLTKERDGLLTQVQDMRAEMERLREDERKVYQAGVALRAEVAFYKPYNPPQTKSVPKRAHPVAKGEYVQASNGAVAQVLEVHKDWYLIARGHGWTFANCSPCDPPAADHDTEAGKAAAQARMQSVITSMEDAVIRDSRRTEPVAAEIKVGDLVEVVGRSAPTLATIGTRGIVVNIHHTAGYVDLDNSMRASLKDVRKVTT